MPQPPIDHEALRERFNPEGSLLRRMQHRMTEMLGEIDKICRRHNLKYWLCSGTLLGCVRHGGYIPWDDDLDIEMLREDYEKLLKILPEELPEHLKLQTPDTDPGYFFQFAKVRDTRSYLEETNDYDRIFQLKGIFIDIFPYEKMPLPLLWISNRTFGRVYKVMNNPQLHAPSSSSPRCAASASSMRVSSSQYCAQSPNSGPRNSLTTAQASPTTTRFSQRKPSLSPRQSSMV